MDALRKGGINALRAGVCFPGCSTKAIRKIGSNRVVLRGVDTISDYLGEILHLALIPGNSADVEKFFNETLQSFKPDDLYGWDVSRWGFLCWPDVYDFCKSNGLNRTVSVFDFNAGQIY